MGIVIRDYEQKDIGGIRKLLFNNGFSHMQTDEIYKWQFFGYGNPIIKVAIDETNNKVVGHYGLMPLSFHFKGKVYRGGKIEGSVVHEDYRGRKLADRYPDLQRFRIFRSLVNEMKKGIIDQGIDFVFGYPNNQAAKTQIEAFGDFSFIVGKYIKVINYDKFIGTKLKINNPLIKQVFVNILSLIYDKKRNDAGNKLKIEYFDSAKHDIKAFFMSSLAASGLTTIFRDNKLLNWKYINNPAKKYSILCAEDWKCKLKGILIFSIDEEKNYNTGNISDIICDLNDKDVIEFLFRRSLKIFSDKGVDIVKFVTGKNRRLHVLSRTLKNMRFIRREDRLTNFLYVSDKLKRENVDIYNIDNWYITSLFSQY